MELFNPHTLYGLSMSCLMALAALLLLLLAVVVQEGI